ncbi:MAG TPA: Rieske (2Fe-2S) protein [Candidatus Limnocylindrales bacterium]|nr:Rieske (2Fe-2S) protein [Candidatus Limnocylindrales bacterium]
MPSEIEQGTSGGGTTIPAAEAGGRESRGFGRRRFIRYLMSFSIVSSLAIVVTPIIGFLIPTKSASGTAGGRVLAGTLETLPVGTGAVIAVGSKPAIVVSTATGVKAYSAICTHLGCIVLWDEAAGAIICPCHDGRFNPATGAVVSGPPPAPLAPLATAVEGNEIYIVTG